MVPPFFLLAFITLLLGHAFGATIINDGKITDVRFAPDKTEFMFKYQPIDKMATLTVMVYPDETNIGNVETSLCANENCTRFEMNYRQFFSIDVPVTGSIQPSQPIDYNFVETGVYIRIKSTSSASVRLVATSSIILTNNSTITLSEEDDYDFIANNYVRYYRLFICDSDPANVYLRDEAALSAIYLHGWGDATVGEPGRPNMNNYQLRCVGTCRVNNLAGAVYPGWVFIGIDVRDLFTYVPGPGEEAPVHSVQLTPNIEVPVKLNPGAELDVDVCLYKNCNELGMFTITDFYGEIDPNTTLTYLIMMKEKFVQDQIGMFRIDVGNTFPVNQAEVFRRTVTDNLIEFTVSDLQLLKDLGDEGYVSISPAHGYPFPQPIPNGESINASVVMMKNAQTVGVGKKSIVLTLEPHAPEPTATTSVDYSRIILNTIGLNKPTYAQLEDTSQMPTIVCDYVVAATVFSAGVETDLYLGAYIGSPDDPVPHTKEGELDYLFVSRQLVAKVSEDVTKNISILTIPSSSSRYFYDGAYLLDVINKNAVIPTTPQNVQVEIAAHPSWNLKKSVQYNMILNGSSRFDFFTAELNSIAMGFSFTVQTAMSNANLVQFSVYASFVNSVPDAESRFSATGYGRVDLFITPEQLKDIEVSGTDYKIYVAVDTLYKGEVTVFYTEGELIQYHISDAESVDVKLSPTVTTAVVDVHTTSVLQASEILFYCDASDNEWVDGVSIAFCAATTTLAQIGDCARGTVGYMNMSSKQAVKSVRILGDQERHPDYFVFIAITYPANVDKSMKVRVFSQMLEPLSLREGNSIQAGIVPRPALTYLQTKLDMDYTMNFNILNSEGTRAKYLVRVCANFPSVSKNIPLDVDETTNIRNCITYSLVAGHELLFDLVGDTFLNDDTVTNDINFITSIHKYISIYPVTGIPMANINIIVHEDDHVDSNVQLKLIWGEFATTSYYRLHVISMDTVHVNDILSFDFAGNNAIEYCLSVRPHVDMTPENCLKYQIAATPEEQTTEIHDKVKMIDIDKYYDAKRDVYVYFAIRFPNSVEGDQTTSFTTFSNVIVHYLDLITSPTDNIDYKSYFFEMYTDRAIAFYTTAFEVNVPFKFMIVPNALPNDLEYTSPSYTNSQIAIQSTTSVKNPLPVPTAGSSEVYNAGIVLQEYTISQQDIEAEGKYFIIVAAFADPFSQQGLYKAGFIATGEGSESPLKEVRTLVADVNYSYAFDFTSEDVTHDTPKFAMFHYPFATSENALRVYPCAGAAGLYMSYINPVPAMSAANTLTYPSYGYIQGRPFKGVFIDVDSELISVPTGFMVNATVNANAYYNEEDPFTRLRWDAEMRLVTTSSFTATGGPNVSNGAIRLVKQKGAELTLEINQALTGYPEDPRFLSTAIEYTVYVIPAVDGTKAVPFFDASPDTHCGLMKFGLALLEDKKTKLTRWIPGTIDPKGGGTDNPDEITGILRITTNVNPNDISYPEGVKPNYYNPKEDAALSENEKKNASYKYNLNIVAREVAIDADGNRAPIGTTAYNHISLEIKGELPTSEGGLFGWEIAVIVVACLVIVGIILAVVIVCLIKKRKSMGYQDVDGQGAPKKESLDVELPEDLDVDKKEGERDIDLQ